MHDLVGLFFWCVLIALWAKLFLNGQAGVTSIADSVVKVSVAGAAIVGITLWWIGHNVAIHRAKGPRGPRAAIPPRVDEDRLGRRLKWSLPEGAAHAASEPHLVIEFEHGVKEYTRP